jgi:SPP1 gp7 family putative phage head morphogenesis protein
MTVNPPKLGLKDLAMPELRNMNKEEILMAYRVPETMLGARGSNRAEADSLERSFSKGTILPLLKFREARLNEFFWPRYDNRLECEFEVDVPADKESELAERVAHLQNYVLSINEVRESQGLPRAPWGDVPLAPFNVGPLGSGGVPAVPPVQDMARASVSAGIHTCGHEHATGTPAVKDGQDGKWGTRAERDHLRETVWREIIDKMAPRERKLKAAVAGYFAGLRRVILRNLDKGVLEPDVVVPQAREQVERFGAEVEPYLREIMEAGFRDSVARAGGKVVNDKAVRAARSVEKFVLDFDVVAEAIATYFSDKWLPVVATVVIGNQLDQVRDELTAGLAAGESVGQLRGRMDDLFGSDPEHLTFVRTESMRAYNDAAILSYQAAGLEKMMWLTSQDDVVCDQCEPLDGTIWPVGGAALSIDHGLGEDVETGAQPPMPYHGNCRCVWEPVIDVPEA